MTPSAARRQSAPAFTILDALEDRQLFGSLFQPPETWSAWRVFLSALFGLPLEGAPLEVYRRHTGPAALPAGQCREAWLIAGRRSGRSRVAGLVAVWLAISRDLRKILAPGERATVMVIAADRRQARTVFRYVQSLLEAPRCSRD